MILMFFIFFFTATTTEGTYLVSDAGKVMLKNAANRLIDYFYCEAQGKLLEEQCGFRP